MTLRELAEMAESRVQHDWSQTAAVLALIANAHRDPKKRARPFKPGDFFEFGDANGARGRGGGNKESGIDERVKVDVLKEIFKPTRVIKRRESTKATEGQ